MIRLYSTLTTYKLHKAADDVNWLLLQQSLPLALRSLTPMLACLTLIINETPVRSVLLVVILHKSAALYLVVHAINVILNGAIVFTVVVLLSETALRLLLLL
jgi:hypothetical protein